MLINFKSLVIKLKIVSQSPRYFANQFFGLVQTPENSLILCLWHEAIAGRLASYVASAYVKCIVTSGSPNILFWADNCGPENKKWTLFTAGTKSNHIEIFREGSYIYGS